MPTYDYKCSACKHAFEHFQGMKEKVLRTCPNCGKKALERLIGTGAAIVFKGSGFYQTDYRSEGYKKAKEADGKPPASDAKPAESAATAPAKSGDSSEKAAAQKPAEKAVEKTAKPKDKKSK